MKIRSIVFAFIILFLFSCDKEEDEVEVPCNCEPVGTMPSPEWIIKDYATEKGILFGMTFDISSDSLNKAIFEREVNAGQVAWYPAWGGWAGVSTYDFSEINAEINYVDEQGIPVMMHLLFGPNTYLPEWFKNGSFTPEEMEMMMQDLVQSIMTSNSNGSKVDVWNVINEATSWDGDEWENSKWLELGYEVDQSGLTGEEKIFDSIPLYIGKAFEYASQYTDGELEIRDYLNDGIESRWDNSELKTKAFYQITKHLVNKGTPIDAVGFQGHMNIDVPATFSRFTETVEKYKMLGLKVYITELDAEQNDQSTQWNNEISEAQADYYYNYVKAGLDGGVDGIFTWGIRDDQDPWWRYEENPLLFDFNGNKKDAYYGVLDAFIDSQ